MTEVNEPILQIREFKGAWSVMARVWTPQKEFYEHPKLINLTEEEARKHCQEFDKNPPTVEDIVKNWVYIGS